MNIREYSMNIFCPISLYYIVQSILTKLWYSLLQKVTLPYTYYNIVTRRNSVFSRWPKKMVRRRIWGERHSDGNWEGPWVKMMSEQYHDFQPNDEGTMMHFSLLLHKEKKKEEVTWCAIFSDLSHTLPNTGGGQWQMIMDSSGIITKYALNIIWLLKLQVLQY